MNSNSIDKTKKDKRYDRLIEKIVAFAKKAKEVISKGIKEALESTPPDLAADIVDRGVMLTGGGALLGDLDLALREQTGLAISVADDSMNCVALGTGKSLEFERQLAHVIDYGT